MLMRMMKTLLLANFELSDAQQEYALTVESLAPRLAALRIELCPGYISESSFWKIYFVLLHPRLEPHAAALLSRPEVIDPECVG
uniref:Putative BSD domain-containing protein n=1 Tax=Helianthus annuus TaxID=4232 RepID=A0A251UJ63_HELAN